MTLPNRSRRGVTLIELLIAMSMLSLLSVGILMAMRMGLGAMARTNARLMANRKVQSVSQIIEHQLNGLMPVHALCVGSGEAAPPARIGFFQGETETMRFVSNYSLDGAARGYPRVLEYQVIAGENNKGVRLVVNEHLYSGPISAGRFCTGLALDPSVGLALPQFVPVEVGANSFVLADKLAYCRFIYREPLRVAPFVRWTPRWVQAGWPTGIRIEMEPLEADGSRLQLGSFTVPIPIRKDPTLDYEDE